MVSFPIRSFTMPSSVRSAVPVKEQIITLSIQGMTCASCVRRVEMSLSKVDGVGPVSVNLATERATVQGVADTQTLIQAVQKVGYQARVVDAQSVGESADAVARKDAEYSMLRRDLLLATVLALPVFILEMGSHLIPAMHHWVMQTMGMQTSWYVQFVLTTLVLLIPGRRFYTLGLPALVRMAPDMNSLVAVGTLAAYSYSVVATFFPGLLPQGTINVY
jgi:Au+-exporting ATPase